MLRIIYNLLLSWRSFILKAKAFVSSDTIIRFNFVGSYKASALLGETIDWDESIKTSNEYNGERGSG